MKEEQTGKSLEDYEKHLKDENYAHTLDHAVTLKSDAVEQLAVSEQARDLPTSISAKSNNDDTSSVSESSDEDNEDGNGDRKELGMIINALQGSLMPNTSHSKDEASDNRRSLATEYSKSSSESAIKENARSLYNSTYIEENVFQSDDQKALHDNQASSCPEEDVDTRPSEDAAPYNHANQIIIEQLDLKNVQINTLPPRDQERADEPILRALRHLFNNRFMKAKGLFEKKASSDPLHALGLGYMAFLKAIMTLDESRREAAMNVLMATYDISTAQIDVAANNNVGDKVFRYLSSYYNQIRLSTGKALPTSPRPVTQKTIDRQKAAPMSNGILRAHIAKAECSLLMAILHLLKEKHEGYIICGRHLQRAHASYMTVWQEYKRMGQHYNDFIDRETVSGIQFGIGAAHLLLSALPIRIRNAVSAVSWKPDKHLGFALLKLCVEERHSRSPLASLMLLAYYIVMTSHCPQILASEYTQPAIEALLDAQRTYPNSALFLYFAGRTSRLAHNLSLSTQSFTYAIEISKNEWAEVEVLHMCNYEIGFNYMMQHNWKDAAAIFERLAKEGYWSPILCRYLHGACLDMIGLHTEAILAFADISNLPRSICASISLVEQYVQRKIQFFQESGYQDMDMTLCAVEYLYLFNALDFMDTALLDQNLSLTDTALNRILEAEKLEYKIRTQELLPDTPPPQYFDQRSTLLLIKASLLNSMGCYEEAIVHINWIIDHKQNIGTDKWIIPFAFWEAGVTSWGLDDKSRGRHFWETAAKYTKYDFETRLSFRLHLALTKANELGVPLPEMKQSKDKILVQHSPRLSVGSSTLTPKTPTSPSSPPPTLHNGSEVEEEKRLSSQCESEHENDGTSPTDDSKISKEESFSSPAAEKTPKDSSVSDDGIRSTLSID